MADGNAGHTAKEIRSFTARTISLIDSGTGSSKSEKSKWRHAFAKPVCSDIEAWGLLQRDIPKELSGNGNCPSYAENAVYMAVAAWAANGKHADNITLGRAVFLSGEGGHLRKKFTRLEKSRRTDEFWRNLKEIIRIISSKNGSGVDYGLLACDIYFWQFDHIAAARRWERDYYNVTTETDNE